MGVKRVWLPLRRTTHLETFGNSDGIVNTTAKLAILWPPPRERVAGAGTGETRRTQSDSSVEVITSFGQETMPQIRRNSRNRSFLNDSEDDRARCDTPTRP